jgi:hypothetical protein
MVYTNSFTVTHAVQYYNLTAQLDNTKTSTCVGIKSFKIPVRRVAVLVINQNTDPRIKIKRVNPTLGERAGTKHAQVLSKATLVCVRILEQINKIKDYGYICLSMIPK